MGLFSSLEASSSALSAQRLVMDVISNNIANAQTTRTPEGGVFRRSRVLLQARDASPIWEGNFIPKGLLALTEGKNTHSFKDRGVRVTKIQEDEQTPTKWVHDPSHPDALQTGPKQGWVELPNVEIVKEMTDMITASKAYEANLAIIENTKMMFNQTLDVLRGV